MVAEKQKVLFQVDVEINLCNNPKVHNIFTNEDAGRDMVVFLRENNIQLHSKEGSTEVTHISIRGSPAGLNKFVNTYFTADEAQVVYNLTYR